jgi:hypothetical protein
MLISFSANCLLILESRNQLRSRMSFSFLSSAFSERKIRFDRKIRKKNRSRMAKKLIMFALKVGEAFQSTISALQRSDGISPPDASR